MQRTARNRRLLVAVPALLAVCALSCGDDTTPAGPGNSSLSLFINEFLAANRSGMADPDFGERGDWIEIYNGDDAAVDVGGFFLTDDPGDPELWAFPDGTVIEDGGYLLVWADGRNIAGAALHAAFRLNSLGEEIALFDDKGAAVDRISFGEQLQDVSTGRTTDGAATFFTFERPTPGESNTSPPPDLPPAILAVTLSPPFPAAGETVRIDAAVTDDSAVAAVKLHHDAGGGFVETAMSEAAPGTFTADIPAATEGTTVLYFIEASDDAGSTVFAPPGAPDSTWSYTVDGGARDVRINEFLASNDSANVDPDFGGHGDWVEIYNGGAATVDMGGWTITDDLGNPDNWTFPAGATIDAGGFLLVWTDGMDSVAAALHADFRLDRSGEQVGLFHVSGAPVDTISYGGQITDVSYGRLPDGADTWESFETPTPGASNGVPAPRIAPRR